MAKVNKFTPGQIAKGRAINEGIIARGRSINSKKAPKATPAAKKKYV